MTDEWLEKFEQAHADRETADRTFTLLGEELTVKASVAPDVGLRLTAMHRAVQTEAEDLRVAEAALEAAKKTAAEAGEDPASLDQTLPQPTITVQHMIDIGDATVLACLVPDSHDAWRRLRDPDHPQPLTFAEILSLCNYLIGRASGIPTGGPAASPNGPTPTAATSTDESSSPAETPTA